MPSRADEYWASEKEDLRYCYKHKHYYRVDFGCQLCILEKIEQQLPQEVTIELIGCPVCAEKSLGWFELQNQFECMNPRCKSVLSKEKLDQILKPNVAQASATINIEPDTQIQKELFSQNGFENNSDILICPECCDNTLSWNISKNLYKCNKPGCSGSFTKEQLRETYKAKLTESKDSSAHKKNIAPESKPTKNENLVKCPICWKITVYFASDRNVYECLKCQRVYSESEYKTLMKAHDEEPKGKGWFGNEYWDPKRKKWRKT